VRVAALVLSETAQLSVERAMIRMLALTLALTLASGVEYKVLRDRCSEPPSLSVAAQMLACNRASAAHVADDDVLALHVLCSGSSCSSCCCCSCCSCSTLMC